MDVSLRAGLDESPDFRQEKFGPKNRGRVIASGETSGGHDLRAGLWLHFRPGPATTHDELRRALQVHAPELLSHDFGLVSSISGPAGPLRASFELVLDGLTFEVFQVSPRPGFRFPDYDFSEESNLPETGSMALVLVPGPHLSGAPRSLPVVRGQFLLGARLIDVLPQIAAAGWPPGEALLAGGRFSAQANAWARGGALPSTGLISIRSAMGGALQSAGLAYFTGQELRIEPDLARERDRAIRLALRLAESLLHRGPLREPEIFGDPAGGTIRLEPSRNGRFIRVWPG
ncbi:MAG: hypothetical protein ACK4GD_00690 [Sphingomonadaceae bacterium]